MTALTMPARPDKDDAGPRPLPWRRMAGVTWRQHRIALAGVAVLLGALAVWLWIEGTSVHHAWDAVTACHPASSPACQDLANTFNGTWDLMGYAAIFLQLLPALIGAFVGAPVLARELETGTFRYAWTQGFGRWRWALAKLVALAVVLAAATGAFSVLLSWCYQPYLAAGNQALGLYGNSPLVTVFSLREVTFPAWTLAVFAIGALAGMLIRRVVPAIVASLAVYAGLAIAAAGLLREHYLTPLVTSSPNVPGTAWILGQSWTKDGRFAFAGNPPLNLLNQFCNFTQSPGGKGGGPGGGPSSSVNPFAQCLAPHGYTQWTSYQPASRFWPFQWIEGGWLLALSALLIAAAIWLVHRRAA
jgi:ABC-2 family transporter protein